MSAVIETERDILHCLRYSDFHMNALRAVRMLALPESWIGAGFVRNYVWDLQHGFKTMTPLNDIDVLYFDRHLDQNFEKEQERKLAVIMPGQNWSVKNQARMHLKYNNAPYSSVADALSHWCETVTPIAARLDHQDELSILAPLGINDLLTNQCHPTPYALSTPEKLADYRSRMREKKWWEMWPRVRVHGLETDE